MTFSYVNAVKVQTGEEEDNAFEKLTNWNVYPPSFGIVSFMFRTRLGKEKDQALCKWHEYHAPKYYIFETENSFTFKGDQKSASRQMVQLFVGNFET